MIWVWAKRWLLFAIGVPILAWVLDQVASTLEESRGRTKVTEGLHGAADKARQYRGRKKRRRR